MTDLILTEDEKQMLADEPRELTKSQRMQVESKRACEAFLEKHDELACTTANLELLVSVLQRHELDPCVESSYEQAYSLLSAADLFESAGPAAPVAKKWTRQEVEALSATEYKQHYFQTPGFKEQVDAFDEPQKPNTHNHARKQ